MQNNIKRFVLLYVLLACLLVVFSGCGGRSSELSFEPFSEAEFELFNPEEFDSAGTYIRGTQSPDFMLDSDNAGAGADTSFIFNRGSSGDDAVITWDETADTLFFSNSALGFDVRAYGATGDGVTDDTAAIEAAITAASSGDVILFPPGTYVVGTTIDIDKSISLVGSGMNASIIDGSGIAGPGRILVIDGAITGTNTTLTGNAATGQAVVDVTDASSFSADDWIRVRSAAGFNNETETKLGELQVIEGIAVNAITCTQNLADTYNVADTATIDLVTMLESVRVEGLKFIGRGVGDTSAWLGVDIKQAQNVIVRDCWFIDCYSTALTLLDCVSFSVSGCVFENSFKVGLGYGVVVGDSSRDGVINGNNFVNNRHSVTMGATGTYGVVRNIVIDGNTVRYTDLAVRLNPFTWHNTCQGIVLSDNVVWGDGLATLLGTDLTVSGNKCYQDVAGNPAILFGQYTDRVVVTGNTIYDTQNIGIQLSRDNHDILISDNYIYVSNDSGIYCLNGASDGTTERILISNNVIDSSTNCIRFRVYTSDINFVLITDNVFLSTAVGINLNDNGVAGQVQFVRIENNIFTDCTIGINCQGVQYLDITGNTINSASSYGIGILTGGAGVTDYTIHDNRFIACADNIVDQSATEDPVVLNNVVLQNTANEDSDGGRESALSFEGEQSGNEVTTLAKIEGSHVGAGDDEKGQLKFYTNDTNDGDSPTLRLTIDNDGGILVPGSIVADTYNFAADGEANDTYVIALDPAAAGYVVGMMIVFTANTANLGACTVNVNGLGPTDLKAFNDQDPPDDYIEAGSVVIAVYDDSGDFQMLQADANP